MSQTAERIEYPDDLAADGAWDVLVAWQAQARADAQKLAEAGKPMRFADRSHNLSYLISPEVHEGYPPGTWRVTTFGKSGEPYGHFECRSAFDAFKEATFHRWVPIERSPRR